jgi:hypothetical protein
MSLNEIVGQTIEMIDVDQPVMIRLSNGKYLEFNAITQCWSGSYDATPGVEVWFDGEIVSGRAGG